MRNEKPSFNTEYKIKKIVSVFGHETYELIDLCGGNVNRAFIIFSTSSHEATKAIRKTCGLKNK